MSNYREPDHNKRNDRYTGSVYRTHNYDGSIHPKDLLHVLREHKLKGNLSFSGSDWKYGYPHKFYLHVENPTPDNLYKSGSGPNGDTFDKYPRIMHKFYSKHLEEVKNEPYLMELLQLIKEIFEIDFFFVNDKLKYSAPRHNHQVYN